LWLSLSCIQALFGRATRIFENIFPSKMTSWSFLWPCIFEWLFLSLFTCSIYLKVFSFLKFTRRLWHHSIYMQVVYGLISQSINRVELNSMIELVPIHFIAHKYYATHYESIHTLNLKWDSSKQFYIINIYKLPKMQSQEHWRWELKCSMDIGTSWQELCSGIFILRSIWIRFSR
jgi:hypothetical protein